MSIYFLATGGGLVLLAGLFAMVVWMTRLGLEYRRTDPMELECSDEIPSDMRMSQSIRWLLLGLIVLLVSSKLLVWGAADVAIALGVSDRIIGLTMVALGTSLPEMAALGNERPERGTGHRHSKCHWFKYV